MSPGPTAQAGRHARLSPHGMGRVASWIGDAARIPQPLQLSGTSDGVRSYTHDAERRLTSVSQGGQTILSFVYDFNNKRLKRTANGVTTVYVGERYEIDLATGQTMAYYPWEGTPLPMRQGNNLYLLHTDNLGSVTRATDGNGANVATARYSAYGALLTGKSSGTLPTDRGFTGQIRDASASGWEMYFFRSRYYNAATGRFLEPDTVVPDPKNPQALNRFAYALDNPLKLVDPSGHDPKDWFNQQWVKEFRTAHNGADPQANDYAYRFVTMAQASGTPVPELFAIPPGTDIGKNLQYGRQMSKFAAMSGQGDQGNSIFSFFNFVGLVRPNGRWDYKHRFGDAYFGFGNFNFGATGAAFGYSEALLERGAGLAQYPATWLANAEIWKLRTFNHDFRYNYQHTGPGNPLRGPTYGDVPDDNAMIKIGYDFYQAYVAAPPPSSVPQ